MTRARTDTSPPTSAWLAAGRSRLAVSLCALLVTAACSRKHELDVPDGSVDAGPGQQLDGATDDAATDAGVAGDAGAPFHPVVVTWHGVFGYDHDANRFRPYSRSGGPEQPLRVELAFRSADPERTLCYLHLTSREREQPGRDYEVTFMGSPYRLFGFELAPGAFTIDRPPAGYTACQDLRFDPSDFGGASFYEVLEDRAWGIAVGTLGPQLTNLIETDSRLTDWRASLAAGNLFGSSLYTGSMGVVPGGVAEAFEADPNTWAVREDLRIPTADVLADPFPTGGPPSGVYEATGLIEFNLFPVLGLPPP